MFVSILCKCGRLTIYIISKKCVIQMRLIELASYFLGLLPILYNGNWMTIYIYIFFPFFLILSNVIYNYEDIFRVIPK